MSQFKFSVIIPTLNSNNFLLKCLNHLNNQSFKNFEVLLISENKLENISPTNYSFKLKILEKQIIKPGEKRNYAAKISNGEYLCFIDDDAFPKINWLEVANDYFDNNTSANNVILGGPGILPKDDNFFSKTSNLFFCSIFVGNSKSKYIAVKDNENIEFDDWPSANMVISKEAFLQLGGFDINFWPGEDSKLCMKLINSNGKIVYKSDLIVFHYRRSNFLKHFRQIFRYSYTRGIFFQNKDKNSRKLIYTIPSLFMIYFVFIPLSLFNMIYLIPLSIFIILLFIDALKSYKYEKNIIIIVLSRFLILFSICCYGYGFLNSFINRKKYLGLGR